MAIKFSWMEEDLSCGNLHGAPVVVGPPAKIHRRHFFGNEGELEIIGGNMGRTITLNAILNNVAWTSSWNVFDYLKDKLDVGISVNGSVDVTFPDASKSVFEGCTFDRYEMTPQPGHQLPAPLKDTTKQLNGVAGTWWLEVNFFFHQLQAGTTNSTYSADA